MKKTICGVLLVIGMLLIVGIAGGVDHGEPITNGLWCFPVLGAMWLLIKIGGLDSYEEE